jgi:hypothetical protein
LLGIRIECDNDEYDNDDARLTFWLIGVGGMEVTGDVAAADDAFPAGGSGTKDTMRVTARAMQHLPYSI